jgi:endogenous inhibitor of DNA gyrase (YacG/DUF329 family)
MTSPLSTCPICKKPLAPEAAETSSVFPFCSVRCRQIDLMRWLNGDYAIAEALDPERMFESLTDEERDSLGL